MVIYKDLKFEMGHVVRNAWSRRCKYSIHGHSYVTSMGITRLYDSSVKDDSKIYDDGHMIADFGILKKYINPLIDSFDHATMLWRSDDQSIIDLFINKFERVVLCDKSSSCEMQSLLFWVATNMIIEKLRTREVEGCTSDYFDNLYCTSFMVQETLSGRAVTEDDEHTRRWIEDLGGMECVRDIVRNLHFSEGITNEWSDEFKNLWKQICTK